MQSTTARVYLTLCSWVPRQLPVRLGKSGAGGPDPRESSRRLQAAAQEGPGDAGADREEIQRFLIQAKAEGYFELFLLELTTGLRRGELAGPPVG